MVSTPECDTFIVLAYTQRVVENAIIEFIPNNHPTDNLFKYYMKNILTFLCFSFHIISYAAAEKRTEYLIVATHNECIRLLLQRII